MITNGPSAIIALGEPPIVRVIDGEAPDRGGRGVPSGRRRVRRRRARPTLSAIRVPTTIRLPIETDLARQGWLIVEPDPGSLFLDDDRVLLRLLVAQAARAAERREAIRERGLLASGPRGHEPGARDVACPARERGGFRAALEAHPGILLVMDPSGRVGYANEQALRSLGYSATEIQDRTLDDLLDAGSDAEIEQQGTGEAQRRDGSTFPVDFAVSTFESQGERSSIAVLTDISARIEVDRLRETFIGILSHELRTPVTSIYGGSQVLLGRRERLEQSVVSELVTDIAAEAERLQRLIENLLILARVERGEDLVGGEPVLLQRVLPSIVDRERALWVGTSISVSLTPGLPTVRGHDGYVGQVIRNLLNNAVKYGGADATRRDRRRGRAGRGDGPRPRRRPGHHGRDGGARVRPVLPGAGLGRPCPRRGDRPVRLPPDRDRPGRHDLGARSARPAARNSASGCRSTRPTTTPTTRWTAPGR